MCTFLSTFGGAIQENFDVLDDDSFVLKEKHVSSIFFFLRKTILQKHFCSFLRIGKVVHEC